MTNSALVLLSGGQDSTTCLAIALEKHTSVETIAFDYQQRHRTELDYAKKIATIANVPLTILTLPLLPEITNNALTNPAQPITHKKNSTPSTFVDGRNHLFLSYAAIYAKQKNIQTLYTGVCETDYSGYPDCRNEFVVSLNQTLNLAMDYQFDIQTPLMFLTKSETVQKMSTLGKLDWYQYTMTCYEGLNPPCEKCPACLLRKKGFQDAGVIDPLTK